MNRYIDYPEEFEELLTTVIPQIYKMWLVKYVRELFYPIGKLAVDKVTSCLRKKSFITSLIDEFNTRKTPEAQFAYLCDKMDADAMVKKYDDEGRFSLDMLPSKILESERTQEAIENGAKTVGEIFIESDVRIYEGNEIFSELIQFLKNYSVAL